MPKSVVDLCWLQHGFSFPHRVYTQKAQISMGNRNMSNVHVSKAQRLKHAAA